MIQSFLESELFLGVYPASINLVSSTFQTKKVSQEELDFKKPEVINNAKKAFKPFGGSGNRIDGKAKNLDASAAHGKHNDSTIERGVPDYRWVVEMSHFRRWHSER